MAEGEVAFPVECVDEWQVYTVEWPHVAFTLYLRRSIDEYDRKMLDRILGGWLDVGLYGGFRPLADPPARMPWNASFHNANGTPVVVKDGGSLAVRWSFDLGRGPREAIDILIAALEGWDAPWGGRPRDWSPAIERLVIGTYPGFTLNAGEPLHTPWFDSF